MRSEIKNSYRLFVLSILGVVTIWLSLFYNLYSANNPVVTLSQLNTTDKAHLQQTIAVVNNDVKELDLRAGEHKHKVDRPDEFLKYSESDNVCSVEIAMLWYKDLDQKSKQSVMETVLEDITNSKMSVSSKNKLYNFVANEDKSTSALVRQLSHDVTADYVGAYSLFRPFAGKVGIGLGLACLLIMLFLGLTMTIDLAFLTLPIAQYALYDESAGNKRPKFVSIEAVTALKKFEEEQGKRSATGIYFRLKSKQLIALSICLLYLVSGKLYDLVGIIVDYFQNVVEFLS